MRLLFIKTSLSWPRSSGHDVYGFFMMRALARLGHQVALATVAQPAPEAIDGSELTTTFLLDGQDRADGGGHVPRLTWLQERFRAYFGIEPERMTAAKRIAEAWRADAVVAVGFEVLPYLATLDGCVRVWYAADEWVWHHLSQVRPHQVASWAHVKKAAIKGMYERAYTMAVDRVWVVSEVERLAMRRFAGARAVDVVPLGVDPDYFQPLATAEIPRSAVFWGRLDFGPNIQALEWFCGHVWPAIRRCAPDARLTIIGFQPSEQIRRLSTQPGIMLVPDLPDLRVEVSRHSVVVLPMISGGGMKNKLLEAASLGKAIVCTKRALAGWPTENGNLPVVQAEDSAQWVNELLALWSDGARRQTIGALARRSVVQHHDWKHAAQRAQAGVEASRKEQRVI